MANTVFLGNGAHGFEAAAKDYFDRPAAELTLSEMALLVGILPAPTDRNPRTEPALADEARRSVLERVRETGAASDAEVTANSRAASVRMRAVERIRAAA